MKKTKLIKMLVVSGFVLSGFSMQAVADDDSKNSNSCKGLPSYAQLKSALNSAVSADKTGLNLNMWATVVDRDGVVCAVAFSGADRGAQWPGSRVISAQKANTANSFSLNGLALSTASHIGCRPVAWHQKCLVLLNIGYQ